MQPARDSKVTQPSIALPKGGGALKGLGDSFQAGSFDGAGHYTIPLPLPAARALTPQLQLAYQSGGGNGSFGMGFGLGLSSISRKTSKGLPRYDGLDVFLLGGTELVPRLDDDGRPVVSVRDGWTVTPYLPRIEGAFARIEHHRHQETGQSFWQIRSGSNTTSVYGRSAAARLADPDDASLVFEWFLEAETDAHGNRVQYHYRPEDHAGVSPEDVAHRRAVNTYLTAIEYGNYVAGGEERFAFRVEFQYAAFDPAHPAAVDSDWTVRPDPFSSYRSGFEIRNYRLCHGLQVYHQFAGLFDDRPVLCAALHLSYNQTGIGRCSGLSFLERVTAWQYRQDDAGAYDALPTPPLELRYEPFEPEKGTEGKLRLEGGDALPGYLWDGTFVATDLYGEGLPGFLLSNDQATLYWEPMGQGRYGGPLVPAQFPMDRDLQGGQAVLADLEGNGYQSLVTHRAGSRGYYTAGHQGAWEPFVPFALDATELSAPRVFHVDLTGDGLADLVVFDEQSVRWYPSLGTKGYGDPESRPLPPGFPAVVDTSEEVVLTFVDMNGDGLADYVKVGDGEVTYWPSRGYGAFGEPVRMEGAPRFPGRLAAARLHFADLDGSGTADLVYLEHDRALVWFNQSGNRFGAPLAVPLPLGFDTIGQVNFADVLGNGTTCMVLTRIEPEVEHVYVDFAGGRKPYLLRSLENNLGARSDIRYSTSVQQYLADKRKGRADATRLAFPVQVVSEVTVTDEVSRAFHLTRYAYHDGYFDPEERVFRGFGFVETWDTDHYEAFAAQAAGTGFDPATLDAALHVPPTYTRSWYHTGAYREAGEIEAHYRREYYRGDPDAVSLPAHSFSPRLEAADAETYRQGFAALEGQLLRQEVYGLDGSDAEANPFSVSETRVHVRLVQPRHANRYAVCFPFVTQAITWHYERDPRDPRVVHTFNLETDAYGNTLRSASVSYPRRPQPGAVVLPEQEILHAVVDTTAYATLVRDEPSEDGPACRWTGVAYESRSYELKPGTGPGGQLSFEQMARWVQAALASPVDNHQAFDPDETPQARLLTHTRSLFWNADQTAAAGPGVLSYRNLPHHTETALGTAGFYAQVFGDRIDDALMQNAAGYVLQDGTWWQCSPVTYYLDKPSQFYLAWKTENTAAFDLPPDPATGATVSSLFTKSTVEYDAYYLFPVATSAWLSDTVQLTTRADVDYQALQPWRVTDANENVSEVLFDARGQVVVATRYGQTRGRPEGNQPVSAYQPRPATFDDVLARPEAYLQQASTYFYYDLFAWMDRRQPVSSIGLVGEKYASQLREGEANAIQVAVAYSDGFGRAAETKQKTDAGPVAVRGGHGVSREPEGKGSWSDERWIVSGRTVYNNKGLPAQQYLPYFSDTAAYEDQAALQMEGLVPPPSVVHYDALNRAVRTDTPKGFYSCVRYTPWKVETYDANDTAADSPYYQTWNGHLPPDEQDALDKALACTATPSVQVLDNLGRTVRVVENNLGVVRLEHLAALCEGSGYTPAALFDALVARGLLEPLAGDPSAGTLAEATLYWNAALVAGIQERFGDLAPALLAFLYAGRMTTLQVYDVQGRTLASVDPRLFFSNATEGAADYNLRNTYDMAGAVLYTESCDAGEAWSLSNVFGAPVCAWNGRGFAVHSYYDALQRPLQTVVTGGDGTAPLDNTTRLVVYGETVPHAVDDNLMGRPVQTYDEAGLTTVATYTLGGQPLALSQQLRADYKAEAGWTEGARRQVAAQAAYVTVQETDALGRVIRTVAPDGSVYEPAYDRAGRFFASQVWLPGEDGGSAPQTIVGKVEYDVNGQPVQVAYGNGVTTRSTYEATTLRLVRLLSTRPSTSGNRADVLQDIRYTYDPVGNVTRKTDRSWQTVFSANQQVDPVADYRYDPLYRLTKATGRQLAHTGSAPPGQAWLAARGIPFHLADPNDPNQLENYTESYTHDFAGNLVDLRHRASTSWHHRFTIAPDSNRLAGTPCDAAGNTLSTDALPALRWDYRNNLASADLLARDDGPSDAEYYVYSAGGTRVRKVTERRVNGGAVEVTDRLYLGGYEYKRVTVQAPDANVAVPLLERHTLKAGACLIHRWTLDARGRETTTPAKRQFRYQLADSQGSVGLELDGQAALITCEEYFPYGGTAFSVGANRVEVRLKEYRYSGQEQDATGLYYYGARYYPPWLARWLNPDPGGTIDGLNLYAFVGGNPVTYRDAGGYAGTNDTIEDDAPSDDDTFEWHGEKVPNPAPHKTMNEQSSQLGKLIAEEIEASSIDYSDELEELSTIIISQKKAVDLDIQDEDVIDEAFELGLAGNAGFKKKWRMADDAKDEFVSTATMFNLLKGAGQVKLEVGAKRQLRLAIGLVSHFRAPTAHVGFNTEHGAAQHPTSPAEAMHAESGTRHNRLDRMRREDVLRAGFQGGLDEFDVEEQGINRLLVMAVKATLHTLNYAMTPLSAENVQAREGFTEVDCEGQAFKRDVFKHVLMEMSPVLRPKLNKPLLSKRKGSPDGHDDSERPHKYRKWESRRNAREPSPVRFY